MELLRWVANLMTGRRRRRVKISAALRAEILRRMGWCKAMYSSPGSSTTTAGPWPAQPAPAIIRWPACLMMMSAAAPGKVCVFCQSTADHVLWRDCWLHGAEHVCPNCGNCAGPMPHGPGMRPLSADGSAPRQATCRPPRPASRR